MNSMFDRSLMILGGEAMHRLLRSHVVIFGIGGVGGHAAEALCRNGIGRLTLIDHEVFDVSNCNRQIFATQDTIGRSKVECARERLLSIRPDMEITISKNFFKPDDELEDSILKSDYIFDAIDSLSSKIHLIEKAYQHKIPILSCMGTGNKLDPTAFRISDISKTSVCPLARIIRRECKLRKISQLKVVYSEEVPIKTGKNFGTVGSVSFVPGVAGMVAAGEIIKDLITNDHSFSR